MEIVSNLVYTGPCMARLILILVQAGLCCEGAGRVYHGLHVYGIRQKL